MKILLINPPKFDTAPYGIPRVLDKAISPPLSIGYLTAVLEKEKKRVKAIDMFDYEWDKVEKSINRESPDVVGINCLTDRRPNVFKLARLLKDRDKKMVVILGGAHATLMDKQILENNPVDICVRQEGEETIIDLINHLEKKKKFDNVLGITYKEGEKIYQNPPRQRIKNLDLIPFPAYHFFPPENYSVHPYYKGKIVDEVNLGKVKRVSIITSRGCISRCEFCSTEILWGPVWRFRSPKNVVKEIEFLNKKCGYLHFEFADDCFTVNENRIKEICREIIKRKLNIVWFCETRVDCVNQEMLDLMRQAGCYMIAYGVETGDRKLLRSIGKRITPEQATDACQMTKKAGIKIEMYLMVGNHRESEETIDSTIELVKKTEPDEFPVSVTRVYPGTALYQIAKEKKFLNDSYWLTNKPAPYYTAERDLKTLRVWASKISSQNQRVPFWKKFLRPVRNLLLEKTGIWVSKQYK